MGLGVPTPRIRENMVEVANLIETREILLAGDHDLQKVPALGGGSKVAHQHMGTVLRQLLMERAGLVPIGQFKVRAHRTAQMFRRTLEARARWGVLGKAHLCTNQSHQQSQNPRM